MLLSRFFGIPNSELDLNKRLLNKLLFFVVYKKPNLTRF